MLWSVVLYLFVFLCCESVLYFNKNNNSFFKSCVFSIILLSLLAGLRAPSVGTDTLGYYNIFLAFCQVVDLTYLNFCNII